jgi:hypothetical protein
LIPASLASEPEHWNATGASFLPSGQRGATASSRSASSIAGSCPFWKKVW